MVGGKNSGVSDDQIELMGKMQDATNKQLEKFNEEQTKQRELLETQKQKYREFEFVNPYKNMQNPLAGLQMEFENPYEDLTIDTRAVEFQAQQGRQQRADILTTLGAAAGSSGISALAQTMANQGALQAQQMSAGIGQQERQNQLMRAQGATRVQALQAQREQMIAQMEGTIDMTERGGEAMTQQAEMQRQATLLGIEMGGMAGANAAVQGAYANQMSAFGMEAGMLNAQMSYDAQMYSANVNAMSNMLKPGM